MLLAFIGKDFNTCKPEICVFFFHLGFTAKKVLRTRMKQYCIELMANSSKTWMLFGEDWELESDICSKIE